MFGSYHHAKSGALSANMAVYRTGTPAPPTFVPMAPPSPGLWCLNMLTSSALGKLDWLAVVRRMVPLLQLVLGLG